MDKTIGDSFDEKLKKLEEPSGTSLIISAVDRDPVDVLAEDFVDRLRRGEHPSVGDYAAAHPDHAEQLRELLPAVAQMECLKRFRRATGLGDTPPLPDQFGDFRIVRELGRGGMGVVFEAVQESLGRPVALKVLASQSQYDGIRRERFIREAHAAARLHHSNIVPVFGVGEQDSIPYYVMQLIRGQGLNVVALRWRREEGRGDESAVSTVPTVTIRKTSPSPLPQNKFEPDNTPKHGNWRFVAEVGLQAAEALHYAHKQGVLHRDVKPGNLLLDSSNRVWITDFGLAKLIDLNGITASGDILGTLQYLAPECLAGDSDPRSDVYGVGATLYELLTLVPPYPSDTPARLLKQVADTDPISPRQINAEIPLDLETIVLKAMAREPDNRYVSARELARDLQAFLDDRPIKARRQTWSNRMWRWCRRNPAVTFLSFAVAAVLMLAAVVGWVGFARTDQALIAEEQRRKEAETARKEAVQASEKLTANLQLSLAAFEKVFEAAGGGRQGFGMFGWVPPNRLIRLGGSRGPAPKDGPEGPGGPGGRGGHGPGGPDGPRGPDGLAPDASAKMLEAVLAFYDKFAEQNATIPQLQLEAAKAHRRVGEVRVWIGDIDKATISFARAIALLKTLRNEYPDNEKFGVELAQTYLNAPPELLEVDEQKLLESLAFLRQMEGDLPPYLTAWIALKLGSIRDRNKNFEGAETAYREAIERLAVIEGGEGHRPPPVVTGQAWARYLLAVLLTNTNRAPEARKVLTELIEELHDVPDRSGRGSFPQQDAACAAYDQLAIVCEQLGDSAAADRAIRSAQELRRQMRDDPGRPNGPGGQGGPPVGGKGPPPKKN